MAFSFTSPQGFIPVGQLPKAQLTDPCMITLIHTLPQLEMWMTCWKRYTRPKGVPKHRPANHSGFDFSIPAANTIIISGSMKQTKPKKDMSDLR